MNGNALNRIPGSRARQQQDEVVSIPQDTYALTIRVFYSWLRDLSFYQQWFVLLVLLRPFIDMLYFMKQNSPFLSPLYWVGIVTPIAAIYSVQVLSNKRNVSVRVPLSIKSFTGLLIIALFVGVYTAVDLLSYIGLAFKIITPFVLVFYIVRVMQTPKFKENIIFALSLASLVAAILMIIEYFVSPFSRSMGNTSIEYVKGFFADPFSYGMYLNILLITGLRSNHTSSYQRIVLVVLLGGSIVLFTIGHLASMGLLIILAAYKYLYRIGKGGAIPYLVIIAATLYFVRAEIAEDTMPGQQISNELEVLSGIRPMEQGAHGRMSRWMLYLDSWSKENTLVQVIGMPYTFTSGIEQWISGDVHNDFLRMMFTVGVLGLFIYLFVLFRLVFIRVGDTTFAIEYQSMIIIIVVYSFTALPLLVPTTSYLFAVAIGLKLSSVKRSVVQRSQ